MTRVDDVVDDLDHHPNHEEHVHDDVVVIPKGEVSLLESLLVRAWTLQTPEKECGAQVSHGVGDDEHQHQTLHDVDQGVARLSDVADDERDEDDVGEGGVDSSVERNSPLSAEPGRVVSSVARLYRIQAGIEEGIKRE